MSLVAVSCTSTNSSVDADPDSTEESSSTTEVAVPTTGTEAAELDSKNSDPTDLGLAWNIDPDRFPTPEPDPTPIEVSDQVRIGVLDNGLTYYVRSNDSPGGSVALRLGIGAGGVHEEPVGTGVAHFLEHMMFNGTEQFPGSTLDATLRSIGAEIGPDFNAFTGDDMTGYQLQVIDQGENVEIAFDVLSEWASAALIEADEVAAEAPVVREELRLRDESPDGAVSLFFEEAYYRDTPYEGVNVSGTAESVGDISQDDLRAFYDTWYRPDNMAIVAVGDRSLDDLESLIVERFSDLEARAGVSEHPNTVDFELRTEPLVEVLVEPNYSDSFISVDIPIQTWDQSTVGGNELVITEVVLGIAIDNRLREGVESGRLPLRRAGGGYFAYNGGLSYIGFNLDADDLVAGTEVFMTELQASLQSPFTQVELDRAADVLRTFEEQRVQQSATTQDGEYADQLLFNYLLGADVGAIEESVERNLGVLNSLTEESANQHWGWLMTRAAPIVIVVGPNGERTGTTDQHVAAMVAAAGATVEELEDDTVEIEVLAQAPDPVDEIASNELASGGIELVFENGHTVLFVESQISEGELSLVSESPGGRSVMSDEDGPVAATAIAATSSSGTSGWSRTQLRRYLASFNASLTPYVSDFGEGFSGGAASEDAEVLFQLLHLGVTNSAIDDVAFAQQIEADRDYVDFVGRDSAESVRVAALDARSRADNLTAAPTIDQLDALTAERALEIYQDRFSSLDDHTIVVVGDLDQSDLVELARTWIGSLPEAEQDEERGSYQHVGTVSEQLAVGTGTSGGSYLLGLVSESEESVDVLMLADVTSRIVNDRIFTVVREQLGATYGGFAFSYFADTDGDIDFVISVDGDPSRIGEIAETVDTELHAMADGEISEADFDEAVSVVEAELNFISNSFLIEALFFEANSTGGVLLSRETQRRSLAAIDADDVASFVTELLESDQRIDVRNIPAS